MSLEKNIFFRNKRILFVGFFLENENLLLVFPIMKKTFCWIFPKMRLKDSLLRLERKKCGAVRIIFIAQKIVILTWEVLIDFNGFILNHSVLSK